MGLPGLQQVIALSLISAYRKAAVSRLGHNTIPKVSVNDAVKGVAANLGDHRFCTLFVEAQFASMPADWCLKTFKRPYPPFSVVFGAGSMEKYRAYVAAGERTPVFRETPIAN